VLPAPNDDREVWLYPGTAKNPDHAKAPGYAWTGKGSGPPGSATFNGTPVTVTTTGEVASVTVTGDGTLVFGNGSPAGGTLTISRGNPTARTFVKVR